MNARGFRMYAVLLASLLAASTITPARADGDKFTLARYVPHDVFVYVAVQHNPERDFLEGYWQEVFQALRDSGVGNDLLELIGSAASPEQKEEVDRLKQRATELIAGVEWSQLAALEMVFAERHARCRAQRRQRQRGPAGHALALPRYARNGTAQPRRPGRLSCAASPRKSTRLPERRGCRSWPDRSTAARSPA